MTTSSHRRRWAIGAMLTATLVAGAPRRAQPQATPPPPPTPRARQVCGAGARVLIVSAFDDELQPLLAQTERARRERRDGQTFVCGVLADRAVALTLVGVGPANAARTTQRVLDEVDASAVLLAGIAGGIDRDLRVGDVAIPARWARHDRTEPRWFDVDPTLLALARPGASASLRACADRAVCAARPAVVVGGNGVTGAGFVADPAAAESLRRRLNAAVTDMETASVAEVAQRRGVPFVAVRAVSDVVPSGRSAELVEEFSRFAADNAAAAAVALLRAMPRR